MYIVINLFRIGLRQGIGFIKGYLQQIGKNLQVISYSQASRRLNKLNLEIRDYRTNKNDVENIKIAIDSTVISIYNNSSQHNKDNAKIRKYDGVNQVGKLHVALDINSKKVIITQYTNFTSYDRASAYNMLKEIANNSLHADGAYNAVNLYKLCNQYNVNPIIKPRKNARIHDNADHLLKRNGNISMKKTYSLTEWKRKTKYGARSYIESFFFRLKRIFGFSFKNKSEINRAQELLIKRSLINRFTNIGMPVFELAT